MPADDTAPRPASGTPEGRGTATARPPAEPDPSRHDRAETVETVEKVEKVGQAGETDQAQGAEAPPSAAELVSGCREQIDVLDARILTLIQERRAVSERIQRARLGSGGRRVHLAREMEILERYRAELGGHGTRMAMLLLELCRGRG